MILAGGLISTSSCFIYINFIMYNDKKFIANPLVTANTFLAFSVMFSHWSCIVIFDRFLRLPEVHVFLLFYRYYKADVEAFFTDLIMADKRRQPDPKLMVPGPRVKICCVFSIEKKNADFVLYQDMLVAQII